MYTCIQCRKRNGVYNYYTEDKPLFCINCKKQNMIDIENYKTTSKICLSNQLKPEYCNDCKKTGMIFIKTIKCLECVDNNALFYYPNKNELMFCDHCKKENMKKYDNICKGCEEYKEISYSYFI